jgi:hypothetical protein
VCECVWEGVEGHTKKMTRKSTRAPSE